MYMLFTYELYNNVAAGCYSYPFLWYQSDVWFVLEVPICYLYYIPTTWIFNLGIHAFISVNHPYNKKTGLPKANCVFFWVRVLFKIFHVFSMCFPWKVGFFLHHQNVPSPSGHLGLTMVATSPHPPHIVVDHLAETWRQNGLLGSQRFQPTTNNPPGGFWLILDATGRWEGFLFCCLFQCLCLKVRCKRVF